MGLNCKETEGLSWVLLLYALAQDHEVSQGTFMVSMYTAVQNNLISCAWDSH